MRHAFKRAALPPREAAKQFLDDHGVRWQERDDGTIYVPSDLNLERRCPRRLPDLSAVEVAGDFSCENNGLTTLKGAPKKVGGVFNCQHNELASLDSMPAQFTGVFSCGHNNLTSLEGLPLDFDGIVYAKGNPLEHLAGLPADLKFVSSDLGDFRRENIPTLLRAKPIRASDLALARNLQVRPALRIVK